MKVPHNQSGDHNPAEGNPVLADPYEFKGTLKYVGHEPTRTTTFILWEDTITKKYYRSDVYLLQALLNGELGDEAESSFVKKAGLFLTARFGFEQKGNYVLLEVFPPETAANNDVLLDHAKKLFERVLEGEISLRQLKTEARLFMKSLNNS